jgi:hypothetical protein
MDGAGEPTQLELNSDSGIRMRSQAALDGQGELVLICDAARAQLGAGPVRHTTAWPYAEPENPNLGFESKRTLSPS